ncbi:MAG: hypothetical protein UR39_C0006G0042 [Candidatus Woesebacteria bacterium GW2011_GWA1_33_30]|uniref:LysM domain-containing protein n=1 Tax=Candidatus Woesebacteria bacterium GW2011_GWA2_33_28 TaxID=1618561 RepID=A0A0F9ZS17_9BACT|nr:MAG: hypothetical protein UR38_C0006G0012 [Candidatus Woesebacteria bacterium GW2011_GWA2_33_28]KKP47886.1 MAG: hypothetical protein UR39_C0006G0042 [Candidatus Woesebacteria bacterium GW2011_GWA1_33_30]KKP49328.1 MAG: hypothetical protein UR40_C0007G0041 [Microgenomates group bacterium GW2011_GWC1_33_32]KKP52039.1 MAG: hypothetical protein UR44_C0005G0042 [Candidatus Woesebacteria bacterium GW2011_GWB1_33_38]KKP57308.1 MAG: hypothetical protein UR48_C0020G0004 [Microgenomates group bacteriu
MIYIKNIDIKKILKTIKLNESTISMILGALVIVIVGSLVIKYIKNAKGTIPQELLGQPNSIELTQKTHTVAKGENLWDLSVKYYGDGFKWVDIATENKLADASIIEEGQKLVIPELETKETEAITSTTYEVVEGDTLWNIAVRAYGDGYSWVKIASENKLVNPNIIHVGNMLVLPRG